MDPSPLVKIEVSSEEDDSITSSSSIISLRGKRGAVENLSDDEQSINKNDLTATSVLPLNDVVNESVALCNVPSCGDTDLLCVVDLITATICKAIKIIESDPRQLFCYKYTKAPYMDMHSESNNSAEGNTDSKSNTPKSDSDTTEESTGPPSKSSGCGWLTIGKFEYGNVLGWIRNFISEWKLTPNTKCVVLSNQRSHEASHKGRIYFADAHFSRPTQRCPNPLAVAKVRFIITVSDILLKIYPIMITYRFEGYSTLYYAVGERSTKSLTFQQFYIDTILHTKLSFFAEICECRHGTVEKPKKIINKGKKKQ